MNVMNFVVFQNQTLRSPWTNSYDPPLEDGAMPSERLRKLEVEANAAFDQVNNVTCILDV